MNKPCANTRRYELLDIEYIELPRINLQLGTSVLLFIGPTLSNHKKPKIPNLIITTTSSSTIYRDNNLYVVLSTPVACHQKPRTRHSAPTHPNNVTYLYNETYVKTMWPILYGNKMVILWSLLSWAFGQKQTGYRLTTVIFVSFNRVPSCYCIGELGNLVYKWMNLRCEVQTILFLMISQIMKVIIIMMIMMMMTTMMMIMTIKMLLQQGRACYDIAKATS